MRISLLRAGVRDGLVDVGEDAQCPVVVGL
jgi:hypothetical protein